MPTVIGGDFEWDSDKATQNADKHGILFEEAATVRPEGGSQILDKGRRKIEVRHLFRRIELISPLFSSHNNKDQRLFLFCELFSLVSGAASAAHY